MSWKSWRLPCDWLEVVVLLLNVAMCVLEAQSLDVVGDVADASVELLRARGQGGVVVPAVGEPGLVKAWSLLKCEWLRVVPTP